ncbi:MAG: hypothetical protein IPM84_26100 [Anaerolineae bacterium]|nr:hypothetical protein [Anaerolineae bacterium]
MWKPPTDTAIYEIVRNPAYAGAFVCMGEGATRRGDRQPCGGVGRKRNGSPLCATSTRPTLRGRSTKQTRRSWSEWTAHRQVQISQWAQHGKGLVCCKDWRCADTAATIVK